jgi:hypothetical protein
VLKVLANPTQSAGMSQHPADISIYMNDFIIRKSQMKIIESDMCHDGIIIPHGSTKGCPMSLKFGLFRALCGTPGDAMWHHPEGNTCPG